MNAMAAVTVRARGNSMGSAIRLATVQAQRGHRAFAPGGSSGNSCNRSQSGQAMVSIGGQQKIKNESVYKRIVFPLAIHEQYCREEQQGCLLDFRPIGGWSNQGRVLRKG